MAGLFLAAVFSFAACSESAQSGFYPLVMAACFLPLQCAALIWALQRAPD